MCRLRRETLLHQKYDKISKNYRYFTCHRYTIDISKIRYLEYRYDTATDIDIDDISTHLQYRILCVAVEIGGVTVSQRYYRPLLAYTALLYLTWNQVPTRNVFNSSSVEQDGPLGRSNFRQVSCCCWTTFTLIQQKKMAANRLPPGNTLRMYSLPAIAAILL